MCLQCNGAPSRHDVLSERYLCVCAVFFLVPVDGMAPLACHRVMVVQATAWTRAMYRTV